MHYTNFFKRFLLRKNFFRRAKGRVDELIRYNTKNEMDDMDDIFNHLGRKPTVIFDCGANIGFVTHQFNKKFHNATIYAFEPNPLVFSKLATHYKGNEKVIAINAGIGSESGKMIFYVNKNSGTSSFLPPTEFHMNNIASRTVTPEEVAILKIDDVIQKHQINHIDILKLDIEGFEIEAMKGITNLKEKVSFIYAEVNLIPTYQGQPLIDEVITYCRSQGFHFLNFYGINETKFHQAQITNILFMSDNLKQELTSKLGEKAFGY
jgi:FkbM family methyltransferase